MTSEDNYLAAWLFGGSMKPDNVTHLQADAGNTAGIRTLGVPGNYSHVLISSEPSQFFSSLPAQEVAARPQLVHMS